MNALPILTRSEDEIIPESDVLYKAYLVPAKMDLLQSGLDEVLAEKIIYRGSISYFLTFFCWDCSRVLCRYLAKTRSNVPLYLAQRSASL